MAGHACVERKAGRTTSGQWADHSHKDMGTPEGSGRHPEAGDMHQKLCRFPHLPAENEASAAVVRLAATHWMPAPTENSAVYTCISHPSCPRGGNIHPPMAPHRTCISRMRLLQVS